MFSRVTPVINPIDLSLLRRSVPAGRSLLVAVSGGADSVALLHRLRSAPYRLFVGHVDHQLRRGSGRDARFVQALARRWELPCQVVRVKVRERHKKKKETLEEAARVLRYQALGRLAGRWKCQAIVTAHTADDQAETVFMNVLRGAGPTGLAGMRDRRLLHAKSRILLLRPLLQTSRAALRNYLARHKLEWREDPSNRNPQFTRNYVRMTVFPLLEGRFPGVAGRLLKMAGLFRSQHEVFSAIMNKLDRRTL